MRTRVPDEAVVSDVVGHDFLFTWKPNRGWPHRELRKLVEEFQSTGAAKQLWRCAAHRKIHLGDGAYLLKQGKPIGIFGRGTVVGNPKRKAKTIPGQSHWQVLIGFEVSRGDVLWDIDPFLVDENHLLDSPAPKTQWEHQASGFTLRPRAARGIDSIIFDSILIGRGQTTPVDEAVLVVARQKKLIEQATRPDQQRFSETIRGNYRGRCAVTGCVTAAALQAAHISIKSGLDNSREDDNSPANGILLRSDIHALFDRLLITLSEDGTRVEVSPQLTDPIYIGLKTVAVARPDKGPPSVENIQEHRNRFFERLRRHSASPGERMSAPQL